MKALSVSVVKSTTKTNLKHNNREMTKNEMRTNQHIDQEKSDSNVYLVKENIEDLYEREFAEALENYNNKQKRNDRKIENYYDHISNSKKTAAQQEMIFQIGTAEDFENGFDRDIAVEILEKCFYDFKERNPQLKIFNAVIHNDEATPHLHINFVPVAEDYKRGLEKQVAFDRAILQQDPSLDKSRPFENWRAIEVLKIEERMADFNLERKEVGTNKIADVNHFKAIKETERQLESLSQQVQTLKTDKKEIDNEMAEEQAKISALKARREKLEKIASKDSDKALKYADERLKHVKPVIFNKEMVQIPKEDLKDLENAFRSASISNKEVLRENRKLKNENKDLISSNRVLERENNSLERRITPLENARSYDESVFVSIKPTLIKYHDHIQKFLDHSFLPKGFKNLCKGFVSGTLADKDYSYARKVAQFSNSNSFELALDKFDIGSTVKEHETIKSKKLERNQSKSYGMSR